MFKLIGLISLIGVTLFLLGEGRFSIGIPMIFVTLVYSKVTVGYFWFGLHTFFSDNSKGSSAGFSGSDNGGEGGGGCD